MPGGVHEFMKAWEPEEDQIIMEMLDRLGPKWSKIVQRLPGRTVSSVRNRWQRIDKGRRLREAGHESKNRCQQCGKPKRGHVCMARLKNRGETGQLASLALKQWEQVAVGPRVADEDEDDGFEGEVPVPLPQLNPAPLPMARTVAPGARTEGGSSTDSQPHALLSQFSASRSMFGGFNALAAAAEAELQRTSSCGSLSGGSSVLTYTPLYPESVPSISSMSSSSSLGEVPITPKEEGGLSKEESSSDASGEQEERAALVAAKALSSGERIIA